MSAAILLAALIAFPKEGQRLPFLSRCYMSGAVSPGVTNVVVQGRDVAVHPLGGWVTMVDLVEGTNVFEVAGARRTFFVAPRPSAPQPADVAGSAATNAAPKAKPREYAKLPYAGDEPRPAPAGKATSEITVYVDPGHGGRDTGAVSPHGLKESALNLALAKNVRDALVRRGFRVEMTREDDVAVDLYERARAAHETGADAFVSIHHNAPPLDRDPRLVRYHAVYAWNGIGEALARAVNARMGEAFGGTLRNNGVMHANFAVTRSPEVPSCLVETDFLTTPEGEVDCWSRERRLKVADAIAAGVADWAEASR